MPRNQVFALILAMDQTPMMQYLTLKRICMKFRHCLNYVSKKHPWNESSDRKDYCKNPMNLKCDDLLLGQFSVLDSIAF